jgi:hypothetical protein
MLEDNTFYNFIDTSADLKPSFVLYENVSYKFKNNKIVFVDDSFINFTNTMRNRQWLNVHFTEKNYEIKSNINNLVTIDKFDQLYEYL